MLNHITIMGRLTADPELRTTNGDVSVASCTLAVDQDYVNKTTNERETDFINVVAWRGTANFLAKYFQKGQLAVMEGRLQIRSYTDKDGIRRKIAEVVAEHIYFAGSKRDQNNGGDYGMSYSERQAVANAPAGDIPDFEEISDDGPLPF